ncbi:MAG: MurR/RpiR family transcriptional regulator [Roseiflexaceae bacterium]|nr:MurR/RpiR family transcriptional regulator [Roseiflexaceae bacterium]
MDRGDISGLQIVPEGVLARVRAVYSTLSESEQRVANVILHDPLAIIHLSVQALAERIGVSEATIIRCCQSIGYRGLRNLKIALAAETVTPLHLTREDVLPSDDLATIVNKVLYSDIQAIADTLAVLDVAVVEQVVQALLAAPRIEFYGVGSSIAVAIDAYYRFLRIGLPVSAVTDPYMQLASASQLPPTAVAFAISHSGRSVETLNALRTARESGAICVLLSSHANTPIGECAHLQLITAARETVFRTESAASRIAHLSMIDALYVAVSLRTSERSREALARTQAALLSTLL